MLKIFDSILWTIATVFIVYSGIYYTYKLKFVQFRFKDMFKNLTNRSHSKITPFESLMVVLGGRIGVGSIAGVAIAIHLGGVGSIFWLWIVGFLSAPLAFVETLLGNVYQKKYKDELVGGPSFYLKEGVKSKQLSQLYSIIIIFSYIGGFLSIQSNTIAASITSSFKINPVIVGIVLAIISLLIISGGIKNISKASKFLVPFMTFLYVLASFFIIIKNFDLMPIIFKNIISSAFNFKAFGFGIIESMIIGVQRGIFSNEAGLGTGAIASSSVYTDYPARQGFVQMIGIYITTFLICTATALVILSTSSTDLNIINGIELTQQAFKFHLGSFGNSIVIISIILFAFSTILSGYYDGESSLKSLFPKINKKGLLILKIITFVVIIIGSISKATTLWNIVNILTSLLALINIYASLKLKKHVIREYERYNKCVKI